MAERPILFSAPMVRAILAGQKTQTRRAFPMQPPDGVQVALVNNTTQRFGGPGDHLWIRETCRAEELPDGLDGVRYLADDAFRPIENTEAAAERWLMMNTYRGKRSATVPPIHMPRWASRILLEVTDLRVERLQTISEADARAEGCHGPVDDDASNLPACNRCGGVGLYTAFAPSGGALPDTDCELCNTPAKRFRLLWESINGAESWAANPWVWVIGFRRMEAPTT